MSEQFEQNTLIVQSSTTAEEALQCLLVGESKGIDVKLKHASPVTATRLPYLPAFLPAKVASSSGATSNQVSLLDGAIFGSVSIARYLSGSSFSEDEDLVLEKLEFGFNDNVKVLLAWLEDHKNLSEVAKLVAFPHLKAHVKDQGFPYLSSVVAEVEALPVVATVTQKWATFQTLLAASAPKVAKKDKKAEKKEKDSAAASKVPAQVFTNDDIVKPVLNNIDWSSAGLISSLKLLFDAALGTAFPQLASDPAAVSAVITRCANPQFGDFQCNNAMGISKALKGVAGYSGPISPKDVADRVCAALPLNPIVASASPAPNGFVNIKVLPSMLKNTIASIVQQGVKPPAMATTSVLVDFSSPNIAKEMHVGHLRSTIIGDSVCRMLEFCKYDVQRVNHVGDWGTQFGMLITYLQEAFPDILTNAPNISDLTVIYKASKKRFDEDPVFKEKARLNVVNLQSGDPACRAIWNLLCDISRVEFQKVYDALDIKLTEVGESFYNPFIPGTIEKLQQLGLVEEDQGMLIIKLPHFTIPLIVRKSDGGYGYDSTDMAALLYRTETLQKKWLVYITDAGQAPHFHMCFDAAKVAGWLPEESHRVDHIGFGVVCGEDGKRFKTRSSETVRLIDLLDAAKERMRDSLNVRKSEGKTNLTEAEIEHAAQVIGYGAVKYFDLKQNPSTNYIFDYDRMLDTRGDTAVYLMFAYARLASILTNAKAGAAATETSPERAPVDLEALLKGAEGILAGETAVQHEAERALAFELLQFGDVVKGAILELLPNRICDYLKELAVKFTDFVTKCHVLNPKSPELMHSRLLICEATRQVMATCFQLLGIGTLEKI